MQKRKMKLRDLGDTANFIAAVGVIVSLLFVAYEVNQNTEASLAANRHTVIASLREQLIVRAQSPSLAAVIEAAASGSELTPAERSQYRGYLFAQVKSVEDAFARYIEGQLDKEYLDTRISGLMIRDFLGNELGRSLYEGYKTSGQLTADFSQAIDAQLVERSSEESRLE